jgi:hypothetical protein
MIGYDPELRIRKESVQSVGQSILNGRAPLADSHFYTGLSATLPVYI